MASGNRPAPNYADSRAADAVQELRRRGILKSEAIEQALLACPRSWFVPPQGDPAILYDIARAVVIKRDAHGVALSSATALELVVQLLECVAPAAGQHILEIGTGGGFSAALLSRLVGPSGHVSTVEVDQEIADCARRALADHGFSNVSVICGDGFIEPKGAADVDAVLVAVGAPEISPAWVDALSPHGLLASVIKGTFFDLLLVGHRSGDGLKLNRCEFFGGWNLLRSDCLDGGWFPRRLSVQASPMERLRQMRRRSSRRATLRVPKSCLECADTGGRLPLQHPFWLVAALSGVQADYMITMAPQRKCLRALIDEESAVEFLPSAEVEVVGGEKLFEKLVAAAAKWEQLNLGDAEDAVHFVGTVSRSGGDPPLLKLAQWHRVGRYTDLHLEIVAGQRELKRTR